VIVVTDLKSYLNANDTDTTFIDECVVVAEAMVARHIGSAIVPDFIAARAALLVGAQLYNNKKSPNGAAQFTTFDGTVVRQPRDPMTAAYPILNPFLGAGVA